MDYYSSPKELYNRISGKKDVNIADTVMIVVIFLLMIVLFLRRTKTMKILN